MKIKWGALAVDGRGKLGGHVAADGAGGSYLRTKVTPNNPQTMAQAKARSEFGVISQKWGELTEAQRAVWNAAVDTWKTTDVFGNLKKPSGKELFQRLNNQAISAGYTSPVQYPVHMQFKANRVRLSFIDISLAYLKIFYTSSTPLTRIIISSTGPLNKGVGYSSSSFVQLANEVGNASQSTIFYTNYVEKFGLPVAGQNAFVRFVFVLPNGQATPPQVLNMLIQP